VRRHESHEKISSHHLIAMHSALQLKEESGRERSKRSRGQELLVVIAGLVLTGAASFRGPAGQAGVVTCDLRPSDIRLGAAARLLLIVVRQVFSSFFLAVSR
jgi:hypothetical protein